MSSNTTKAIEVNFDGIAGPTHNYAGLSFGNLASTNYAKKSSNPKAAALQGLSKMNLLFQRGFKQGFFPPHERPNLNLLRSLGFFGSDHEILVKAYKTSPQIFFAAYSSSSMWAANAATVSPSFDTLDKKVHFTISNLVTHLHRAQEAEMTHSLFKKIFYNEKFFQVHKPLLACSALSDEGAANHLRFCSEHHSQGLELFVFGHTAVSDNHRPKRYPSRQTKEASESIARSHQLNEKNILFVKQNPISIDQGVFHNDVISVSNQNVFLYHELAFEKTEETIHQIKNLCSFPIHFISVSEEELNLQDCVHSYLFNSQILSKKDGTMLLVAPIESKENKAAFKVLNRILNEDNPINELEFVDCRQSMQNGGGPACLRLRVLLTEEQLQNTFPNCYLDTKTYSELEQWINKYYRDRLSLEDLLDNNLLLESREALDNLTKILKLGSIYSFQNE